MTRKNVGLLINYAMKYSKKDSSFQFPKSDATLNIFNEQHSTDAEALIENDRTRILYRLAYRLMPRYGSNF